MKNNVTEIDQWLGEHVFEEDDYESWNPGFDPDRQLVISRLGPFEKIFLKPTRYSKRIYHKLYSLPIEEWRINEQRKLYDEFCQLEILLKLRFQVTLEYALNNLDLLENINQHVIQNYYGTVVDILDKKIASLNDSHWFHEGLGQFENDICLAISETLLVQDIQTFVSCRLKPSFEDFPDLHLNKENIYLSVLKKNYEYQEQKKEELFRQEQDEEKQKIDHKRRQFKYLNELALLDLQKQTLHAENQKKLLEEKEQQLLEQYEIKKRIHADKIVHNNSLKEMSMVGDLNFKKRRNSLERESEEAEKADTLIHKAKIKSQEIEAKIANYNVEQERWLEAKNKTYAEKLAFRDRQKQLEIDQDISHQRFLEEQKRLIHEENYKANIKTDQFLKREIELLELEKQRLSLQKSINEIKERQGDDNTQAG